jgi:hypothetical protein
MNPDFICRCSLNPGTLNLKSQNQTTSLEGNRLSIARAPMTENPCL